MQFAIQQLRRAAQSAERILNLMAELANHEPAAVEPREHLALARNALPRTRIGELDQQVRAGHLSLERRHGHVDHHRFAVRCFRDRRQG